MFKISDLSETIKSFYNDDKYSLYAAILEANGDILKRAAATIKGPLPSRDPTADPGRRVPGAASKLKKMKPTSGPNAPKASGPGSVKPAGQAAKPKKVKKEYLGKGDVISNKAVVSGTRIADLEAALSDAAGGNGQVLAAIFEPQIKKNLNNNRAEDHFRGFLSDPNWVGFSKKTQKKIGNGRSDPDDEESKMLTGGWLKTWTKGAKDALARYEASRKPQADVGDPNKAISYMSRNINYAVGHYRKSVMTPWEMENEGLEIEGEEGKAQPRKELAKDDNVGKKRAEMRDRLTTLFNDAFVHGVKELHKDPEMDDFYKNIAQEIIFRKNGTIRYRQLIRDPETGIGKEERRDRQAAEKVYKDMVEKGRGLTTHSSPQDFANSANKAMSKTIQQMGSHLEKNLSPEEYKDLEDFVARTAKRDQAAKSEFQKARAAEKAQVGAKMAKSRGQARKTQKGQARVDKEAKRAARMAELRKSFAEIEKRMKAMEDVEPKGSSSYLAEFVGLIYGVNKNLITTDTAFGLLAEFMESIEEE